MRTPKSNPGLRVQTRVRAGRPTIYGNDDPRYADAIDKQIKAFSEQSIGFDYVNCDQETCPTIVRQFKKLPVVMGYPEETDSWDGFQPL